VSDATDWSTEGAELYTTAGTSFLARFDGDSSNRALVGEVELSSRSRLRWSVKRGTSIGVLSGVGATSVEGALAVEETGAGAGMERVSGSTSVGVPATDTHQVAELWVSLPLVQTFGIHQPGKGLFGSGGSEFIRGQPSRHSLTAWLCGRVHPGLSRHLGFESGWLDRADRGCGRGEFCQEGSVSRLQVGIQSN
jgi:hypothetical protein